MCWLVLVLRGHGLLHRTGVQDPRAQLNHRAQLHLRVGCLAGTTRHESFLHQQMWRVRKQPPPQANLERVHKMLAVQQPLRFRLDKVTQLCVRDRFRGGIDR